jgi:hypothetical protein
MVAGQARTDAGGASSGNHAGLHRAEVAVVPPKRALTRRFVSRTMVTPEEISVVSALAAGAAAAASSIAGAHQRYDQIALRAVI